MMTTKSSTKVYVQVNPQANHPLPNSNSNPLESVFKSDTGSEAYYGDDDDDHQLQSQA